VVAPAPAAPPAAGPWRSERERGADRLALRLLPDFPFRPESFFAYPAWLWAAGAGVAAAAAVLGALSPAAAASRVDPGRTIA